MSRPAQVASVRRLLSVWVSHHSTRGVHVVPVAVILPRRRQLELWQSGAHIHMPGTAPLDLARVYATSPLESVLPSSVADVDSRVKAPASAARDGPPTTTSRHFIGLGELAPRHPAQLPAHDPATPASSSAGHGGYGSLDDATFLKRVRGAPLPYEPVNHRRKKPRRNRDKNRQQWATAR